MLESNLKSTFEGANELKDTRKKSKKKKDKKYQIGQEEGLVPVRQFGGAPKIVDMTRAVGFEI